MMTGPNGEKKNLLLVDDTELFLAMEHTYLQRRDFVLHTAKSGIEALNKTKSIRPDLILLDLHMPDLSGDQVCARIKENDEYHHIPVVIATSERNRPTLAKCIDAGCDAFILKPFNKEQLLRTIQELLVISQRQYKRVEVSIPCTIRIEDEGLESIIRNISEGGAFIETGIPLEKESILELGFTLPDIDYPFSLQVVVRWASSFIRMTARPGMGVEFITGIESEREILRNFVEKEHRKKLRTELGIKEK
jgi:CheY-like chemotaxis protein